MKKNFMFIVCAFALLFTVYSCKNQNTENAEAEKTDPAAMYDDKSIDAKIEALDKACEDTDKDKVLGLVKDLKKAELEHGINDAQDGRIRKIISDCACATEEEIEEDKNLVVEEFNKKN